MRAKSISWGQASDPALSLTVGEFSQGREYRTARKYGTPNYLLILTLEGGGKAVGPEGQAITTEPGDILLFNPGTFQNYGTAPGMGNWTLTWSHFIPRPDWNYWADWESCWEGVRYSHIGPMSTGRVRDAFRLVYDADVGTGELAGLYMMNCLERALIQIRIAHERTMSPDRDERIEKTLHFIEANLQGKLPVELLARECGISESRFAHLFRAETGQTPQQYIEFRRMEQARNLLRYSSLSVGEVGRACGFDDPFYFSSRFRKANGTSPRAFKIHPTR